MSEVTDLMLGFAARTGLTDSSVPPRRYLWTDSFAVCNFLGLYRQTGKDSWRTLATELIEQVHAVLGRHRPDDPRAGWVSGLDEKAGAQHPTAGGLRIGKPHNERQPGEPYDARAEWDQDGQYFHYLTKWMHALCVAGRVTGNPAYTRWAVEMAEGIHPHFTYATRPGEPKQMYWKMSIDLSRPLVPSMGLHDPLDGYITYSVLRACNGNQNLQDATAEMANICAGHRWDTEDPLGLGGLLTDAWRVLQLITGAGFQDFNLLEGLLDAARWGVQAFVARDSLRGPASYRLAFRELGLSIGLHALAPMHDALDHHRDRFANAAGLSSLLDDLVAFAPLTGVIEDFWLLPQNRRVESWTDHLDINEVMLATSLGPDGFLSLGFGEG